MNLRENIPDKPRTHSESLAELFKDKIKTMTNSMEKSIDEDIVKANENESQS